MDEDRVTRLCYNINIQYSRGGTDFRLSSPAVFSETLARPLIQNPSQWDVLINKFKIDTFSIPLTIVELQEYQPISTDGSYLTNYWVTLKHGAMYYSAQCVHRPEHNCNAPPKVMNVNEEGYVKYDNCNAAFFVYSYQHFLDMINDGMKNVCHQAGLDSTVPEILFVQTHKG